MRGTIYCAVDYDELQYVVIFEKKAGMAGKSGKFQYF